MWYRPAPQVNSEDASQVLAGKGRAFEGAYGDQFSH